MAGHGEARFGAVRDGRRLFISVTTDAPWEGRLIFDRSRHKEAMLLPLDHPRINQFQEWFVIQAEAKCRVQTNDDTKSVRYSGKELREGLLLALVAGQEKQLILEMR